MASKKTIAIDRIHNFLSTMANWVMDGGRPVETQEAIRRAKVCKECEFNRQDGLKGRCPTCFSRRAILYLFGWREGFGSRLKNHPEAVPMSDNPHNGDLTYCAKCGCDLKLKVFIPLGVIENRNVDYPEWCWQRDGEGQESDSSYD